MPKQKTHTGAKKRFKLKKSGLIKRNRIDVTFLLRNLHQEREDLERVDT